MYGNGKVLQTNLEGVIFTLDPSFKHETLIYVRHDFMCHTNSCFFLKLRKPILLHSFRRWLFALQAQEILDDSGSLIIFHRPRCLCLQFQETPKHLYFCKSTNKSIGCSEVGSRGSCAKWVSRGYPTCFNHVLGHDIQWYVYLYMAQQTHTWPVPFQYPTAMRQHHGNLNAA